MALSSPLKLVDSSKVVIPSQAGFQFHGMMEKRMVTFFMDSPKVIVS